MAFTFSEQLAASHYLLFTFYFTLTGLGACASYVAGLSANVKLFPSDYHGFVVGSHAAFYALSPLFFSQIHSAFFLDETGDRNFEFFITLAITLGVVNLLAIFLLQEPSPPSLPRSLREPITHSRMVQEAEGKEESGSLRNETDQSEREDESRPLLDNSLPDPSLELGRTPPEDLSGFKIFKKMDFWFLFVILGFGGSCGLLYISNTSQIVSSLAYRQNLSNSEVQQIINTHVSIVAAFSCTSRFVIGAVSDFSLKKLRIPRPYFLCLATMCVFAGQALMLFASSLNFLYLASFLIGTAHGFMFSITPILISDTFGTKFFGTCWGMPFLSFVSFHSFSEIHPRLGCGFSWHFWSHYQPTLWGSL